MHACPLRLLCELLSLDTRPVVRVVDNYLPTRGKEVPDELLAPSSNPASQLDRLGALLSY